MADNNRSVNIEEVVEVLEELCEASTEREDEEATTRARSLVSRLVGPERETKTRLTSKYLLTDEGLCDALADDLAVSTEETRGWFLGEPIKRVIAVARWALDKADETIIEDGGVHGQRGPRIAKMLDEWSRHNQTGVNRTRQKEVQYVAGE